MTVIATPAAERNHHGGASPIRSVKMAMAIGSGNEVRWRKSQPPSRVVVSWVKMGDSVGTDPSQFDRVREVDKIRTSSVVYRHAFI